MEDITRARLDQLFEVEKIKQLKARYCRYIDTRQWDLFGELLAEDVHMVFNDVDGNRQFEFFSREEMVNVTAMMLKHATTVHHVHNAEIVLTSSTVATATWAMEDLILFPQGGNAPFSYMHGFGSYTETLEKKKNDWMIKSLTLSRYLQDFTHS